MEYILVGIFDLVVIPWKPKSSKPTKIHNSWRIDFLKVPEKPTLAKFKLSS